MQNLSVSTPTVVDAYTLASQEKRVVRKRKPRGAMFASYVTRRDIAKQLGISTSTISRYEQENEMPQPIYFGGVKLYKKTEIDNWIAGIIKPRK